MNAPSFDECMREQLARLDALATRQREAFADEYARMEAASSTDESDSDCIDMG